MSDMYTSTTWHSRHNLEYRLKTKFRRKLATFKTKNPSIHPFVVTTKKMANNWWGKNWNAQMTYFLNDINLASGNPRDLDRLQLDLKFKYK